MTKQEKISFLIKDERKKQKLSRERLAKKAGCSARIIEYWEEGTRLPRDIETVDKVLSALGISFVLGKE